MKGDFRSYARAAGTSLLGLAIQLVLGIGLLIYSVLGRDEAARTAALHVLFSAPIWLVLAVVFDQHRRERLEALEAESLDATAARESSVFGTTSDDLRVQAKRLAWMHRVLIPSASVLVALALVALGAWRYWEATREIMAAPPIGSSVAKPTGETMVSSYLPLAYRGWAIAVGLGIAVIGFVFARYSSGMAKTSVWGLLRAGAGAAACASLLGLAIALAQFAEILGAVKFGRWLLIAFPVVSMVLGAEILLNFLLNLYRPRKPGEMPRAAMESWLLASVAAPDQIARSVGGAIQYQFGVDVTGSWAYDRLRAWTPRLLGLGLLALWVMSAFTVVGPHERGVRLTLGQRSAEVGPGLRLSWPWPVGRIEKTGVTQLRTVSLATSRPPNEVTHILWTNDHRLAEESKILVRAGGGGSSEDARALMVVEVPLMFTITDLAKYEAIGTPGSRDAYVRAVAKRAMTTYLSTLTADELVGPGRGAASAELRARVEKALAGIDAGVRVVFCGIEGVHPPRGAEAATANAYEQVVADQVRASAKLANAQREATAALTRAAGSVEGAKAIVTELDKIERLRQQQAPAEQLAAQEARLDALIGQAGGEAASIISRARAERWQRVMQERGRAETYAARQAAFSANPRLYMTSAYFDTLSEVLRDARVYIVHDSVPDLRTNIDLKDLGSTVDVFSTETK